MRTTANQAFQASRLLLAAALAGTAIGCVNEPPVQVEEEHPEVIILEELVLTEAARQVELDTAFANMDIQADRLIVGYRGAPMIPISVGNVLGGNEGGGYIRRVIAVNDLGDGRIEYLTEEAALPDFFGAGEFEVRWVGGNAVAPGGEGDAFAEEALSLNFTRSGENRWCNAAAGGNIEVTPNLQTSISPNYRVSFTGGFKASATLSGSVTAGVTVNANANGTFNCAANLGTVLTPAQLAAVSWNSTRSLRIGTFLTMDVTQSIQPFADLQINGNFNTGRTTATISGRASLRAGFEYDDGFNAIWTPSARVTGNFTALEGGMAHVDASLNAGVNYRISLSAGALGFSVSGITGEARLAANVAGAADANICNWTLTANAGASLGLEANALGYNFSREWPLGTPIMYSRMGRVRTCSDANSDAGPVQDTGMAGTARGEACTASDQCAGADICARNGTAMTQCCVGAAGAATSAADCCGGMTLVSGRCTLVERGSACEQTADCRGGVCRQSGGALCGAAGMGCTCQ